jgi:hypothetical protein
MVEGTAEPAATAAVALDLTYLAASAAKYFASLDLAHDAGQLTRLGNGLLRLDLLRRQARHQDRYVPFLRMGDTLRHRIGAALDGAESSLAVLQQADLEVEVRLKSIVQPDAVGPRMGGWCGISGPLIQADLTVTLRLAAEGQRWQVQHKGATTWPESWGRRP